MESAQCSNPTRPLNVPGWLLPAVLGLALGAATLGGLGLLLAAAVAGGVALFFFLPRPALLFSMYCASIPLEAILVLQSWEGVTLARYLGIGSGALLVAQMLRSGRVNLPPPAVFAWAALFAWAAGSVFWAVDPEQTAQSFWLHVRFFILYAVSVIYPFSHKAVDQVKTAIMLSGLLAGGLVLYLYSNQVTYLGTVRASVVLGEHAADPNHVAVSLLLPFSLFLSAALSARRPKLSSHILPLVILLLVVVFSGSRGGLLALALAAISLLIMHFRQYWWQEIKVIAFTVVGAIAVWFLWPNLPVELTQRLVLADVVTGGGAGRLDIWRTGMAAWWANPVLGYGFGGFGTVHTLWAGCFKVAHNIYLQLLVELGLPGAVLLLIALILGLKPRATTSLERGATAGLLAVLVGSLFLGTLNYDYLWLALMMVEIARRGKASQSAHEPS